jgi:hypothetical protein
MSEKRARFVGHPDGAYLEGIPVGTDGDTRRLHVPTAASSRGDRRPEDPRRLPRQPPPAGGELDARQPRDRQRRDRQDHDRGEGREGRR